MPSSGTENDYGAGKCTAARKDLSDLVTTKDKRPTYRALGPRGARGGARRGQACLLEEQETQGPLPKLSFEGLMGVLWAVDRGAGRKGGGGEWFQRQGSIHCTKWAL